MHFLTHLFDPEGFPARWQCGTWSPFAGWLHIVSDILIFIAYSAIPASLMVVLIRRRDVPFPRVLALFVAFILSCGVSHLIDALMFYHPIYRFLGVVKAFTAGVSLVTAFVLIKSLPALLRLPSVQRANLSLASALERERALTAQLEAARSEVEARSMMLTTRTRRFTAALSAAHVVACRWSTETGVIDWELGYSHAASALGLVPATLSDWSVVLEQESVEELKRQCRDAAARGASLTFESTIAGSPRLLLRLSASAEPQVRGEPAIMVGMFRVFPVDGGTG